MTTTKKFRTGALLLALSAAAVVSGSAQAAVSQTQSWKAGSEGQKDVSWAVVKQGEFSFTVSPNDISTVESDGTVNKGNGDAGTWQNGASYTSLSATGQPTSLASNDYHVYAKGNLDNAGNSQPEYMALVFGRTGGLSDITWVFKGGEAHNSPDATPVKPGNGGPIKATVTTWDGNKTTNVIHKTEDVSSTRFVLNLTAKQYQP